MKMTELSRSWAAKNLTEKMGKAAAALGVGKPPESDSLRPQNLSEFIGQESVVKQLSVTLRAALSRGEPVCHLLMVGPGGLGKTTLALMMANEMGAPMVATTAPTLGQEPLTRMLTGMAKNTVFFVDEIHRLSKRTEELLYAAMEDGYIDCNTPMGFERKRVEPFTLVGGTTLPGSLSDSFKDRFGLVVRLSYYGLEDLAAIAHRSARVLSVDLSDQAAEEIASRSRGVPRVTNQLLRRLRDVAAGRPVTADVAQEGFEIFDIDELGLDQLDRSVLWTLGRQFNGGPTGVTNLAIAVGESESTLDKDVEPYLVRLGLIARTPRGRVLTEDGRQHISDMENH